MKLDDVVKKKFLLRINPELWEELNRWADQEFRSVNSQIEFLLREAVMKRNKGLEIPRMNLSESELDSEQEPAG